MKVALIVPAAGSGSRLAVGLPKAVVPIGGKPLLAHTLDRFRGIRDLVEVVVMAPPGAQREFVASIGPVDAGLDLSVVAGGSSRQESVRLGLAALRGDADLVCVHDAARPLIGVDTIARVIEAAAACGAATAARRPIDSIREELEDGATRAVDRDRIWLVETPQVFSQSLLSQAHEKARALGWSATDDAALVELAGHKVRVVASKGPNLKITTASDLELARILLRPRSS